MSKRGHYHGIMCSEMSIKVGKSKKTLNITNKSWGSPFHNGFYFMKIYMGTISKDYVPKGLCVDLMKFTFFQFGVKFDSPNLVQKQLTHVHVPPCFLRKWKCHWCNKPWNHQNIIFNPTQTSPTTLGDYLSYNIFRITPLKISTTWKYVSL